MAFPLILVLVSSQSTAGPPASPFVPINQKLDTIQQTLDNQVVPLIEETEPRIPISSLPYTIDTSGSYYLTSDLTSEADGIIVNADNVTIDLMGFSLIGTGSGTTYGIYMDGRSNVEIRNGTVRDFGSHGIYEASSDGKGHRVIGIRATYNGSSVHGNAIYLLGMNHLVKNCTASYSGYSGRGIWVGSGCSVVGNISHNNEGINIQTGNRNTVTNNVCYISNARGISTGHGCLISGNYVYSNKHQGILAEGGGLSTITGNTCIDNAWGISVQDGCKVTDNTCLSNREGGIAAGRNCIVKGNLLRGNNTYNIHAGTGSSVEENLVTLATYGIYFQTGGNFFANNRASGNATDYGNTAGNTDGGGNVSF